MARNRKKKGRSEKGLGTLTLRGRKWYFRVTIDGQEYPHATGTDDIEQAKLERDRFLQTVRGTPRSTPQTVTVSELLDDYIADLHENHKKDAEGITEILNANIRPTKMFKDRLAASITTQDLRDYRAMRKAMGRKDATINNELAYLRASFYLGKKCTPNKVTEIPYFPIVKVNNTRKGFIEVADYLHLCNCLCDSLKPFLVLAYHSGCRKGELTNLRWSQVNRQLRIIELEPGETKNGEGRNLPFYGDMEAWLDKQQLVREAQCPECEYVLFWHKADAHFASINAGSKLNDFEKMWDRGVRKAGVRDLIPHDLRRSAVRNMVKYCNIPESEAMIISGHKTRAMLDRYNIVSLQGIISSGNKMDAWMRDAMAQAQEQERLNPRPIEPEPLTVKQRVRQLYYVEEKTVEDIMAALNIAESTVYYHLSKDGWRKKTDSVPAHL